MVITDIDDKIIQRSLEVSVNLYSFTPVLVHTRLVIYVEGCLYLAILRHVESYFGFISFTGEHLANCPCKNARGRV